jgi:hypothetical protein
VRSDLLEFPTGSLPVIRAFQIDEPQMRKLRRISFHGRLLQDCPSSARNHISKASYLLTHIDIE